MPIYEFICESCGNEFEQIRSFSDSSVPECTKCGSSQVVRRMGRPAIHFKGSGWYVTDSKKSSDTKGGGSKSASDSTKSESSSDGGSATDGKSGDGKSESKTETKRDSSSEGKSDSGSKSESATTPKSSPAPVASD